jgi:hypothetical protein
MSPYELHIVSCFGVCACVALARLLSVRFASIKRGNALPVFVSHPCVGVRVYRSTDLLIRKLPFQRLVREIAQDFKNVWLPLFAFVVACVCVCI